MRKQSIPGRFSPPTWPGYEANQHCGMYLINRLGKNGGTRECGWWVRHSVESTRLIVCLAVERPRSALGSHFFTHSHK